ncbi:MAG TPA: DUF4159 domain-containing protein [Bryobacteraceae bacterium]|nr:DUF4159 domain-containing protein [Bryobacteraceae bacterium]
MTLRRVSRQLGAGLVLITVLYAFQRPFREYPGREYSDFPIPPDWQEKTEWVFARLMYPPAYGVHGRGFRGGYGRFGGVPWTQGYSSWTTDYPRSDRHFSAALRRLTRVHTRSAEQPVNLDEGDQYDWPWLYAVEVGHWELTDAQAKGMREYLDRGGFFMCDDFHGTEEWEVFQRSMKKVFPDRQIVDLANSDDIFHVIYDLDDRYQVPGAQWIRSRRTYEYDGYVATWRGVYDEKGRLVVAICHNMDLGDSWEHADNPEYPQQYSALGIRIGVNYVVYAMTH